MGGGELFKNYFFLFFKKPENFVMRIKKITQWPPILVYDKQGTG